MSRDVTACHRMSHGWGFEKTNPILFSRPACGARRLTRASHARRLNGEACPEMPQNAPGCPRMPHDLGFEKTNPIPAEPVAGDAFTVARASRPCLGVFEGGPGFKFEK